jgi:hypothetical protein
MTLSYKNKLNTPTSNDEWPEFTVQLNISEQTRRMIVPTAPNKPSPKQHINVKSLSAQDLNALKKKDAFMYYSIPAVRYAALLNKAIDMSKLDEVPTVMKRNCTSCPSRMMTQQFDNSRTVERASRISFECHADMLLVDLLEEEKESDGEDSALDAGVDVDVLASLLERFSA